MLFKLIPCELQAFVLSYLDLPEVAIVELSCRPLHQVILHYKVYREYYNNKVSRGLWSEERYARSVLDTGRPIPVEHSRVSSLNEEVASLGWKGFTNLYQKQTSTWIRRDGPNHLYLECRFVDVPSLTSDVSTRVFSIGELTNGRPILWRVMIQLSNMRLYLEPTETFPRNVTPDTVFFIIVTVLDVDTSGLTRRSACSYVRSSVRWCLDFNPILSAAQRDFTFRVDFTVMSRKGRGTVVSPTLCYSTALRCAEGRVWPRELRNSDVVCGKLPPLDDDPLEEDGGQHGPVARVPRGVRTTPTRVTAQTAVFDLLDVLCLRCRNELGELPVSSIFCGRYRARLSLSLQEPMSGILTIEKTRGSPQHSCTLIICAIADGDTIVESHANLRRSTELHSDHRLIFDLKALQRANGKLYIHILEFPNPLSAAYFTLDLVAGKYQTDPPLSTQGPDLMDIQTNMYATPYVPQHTPTMLSELLIYDLLNAISHSLDPTTMHMIHYACSTELVEIVAHSKSSKVLKRAAAAALWGMMDCNPIHISDNVCRTLGNALCREISQRDAALLETQLTSSLVNVLGIHEILLQHTHTPSSSRQKDTIGYETYMGTLCGVACNLIAHKSFQQYLRDTPDAVSHLLDIALCETWSSYHFALLNVLTYLKMSGAMRPRHGPKMGMAVEYFVNYPTGRNFRTRLSTRDMTDFFIPYIRSEHLECVKFGQWCIRTMYAGAWNDTRFTF